MFQGSRIAHALLIKAHRALLGRAPGVSIGGRVPQPYSICVHVPPVHRFNGKSLERGGSYTGEMVLCSGLLVDDGRAGLSQRDFFFFLISLIADGPHHYHPACGH